MFATKPNYVKLRTNLKLCINRLKLLEKKKTEQALKARKEIADYLAIGKDDRARIRVEHIIREDYMVEAMEIIEMLCDLVLARFGLVEKMIELDPGLEQAIATIIWVTPRLSGEILELKEVALQFVAKYGKEFADMCRQNQFHNVHEKVIYKMNLAAPPKKLVENYLIEIAKSFKIAYEPESLDIQNDIPESGDLLDLGVDTMPTTISKQAPNPSNDFNSADRKFLEASGFDINTFEDQSFGQNSKNSFFQGQQNFNGSSGIYDNNHNNDGLNFQGEYSGAPPPIPSVPPNASLKRNTTLTTQLTWDNEELPQLPPYESVVRNPFNYPTVPGEQQTNQHPFHLNQDATFNQPFSPYNPTQNPAGSNYPNAPNQPFNNPNLNPADQSYPNRSSLPNESNLNPSGLNNTNVSNPSPANPPYPIAKPRGFPVFPDIPGLPSVPTDSLHAGSNEDIDFDDLTRRFEELKKKK